LIYDSSCLLRDLFLERKEARCAQRYSAFFANTLCTLRRFSFSNLAKIGELFRQKNYKR